MFSIIRKLFYVMLISGVGALHAQHLNIDSLVHSISLEKEDTLKVKTLYVLSRAYSHDGNYHEGIKCALRSEALADSLLYSTGVARADMAAGIAYYHLGKFPEALKYDLEALKKYELIGSALGIGDAHNLVGNVYYDQRDYANALEQYTKAESCFRSLGQKQRLAGAMNNVANVFNGLGEFQKAIGIYDSLLIIQQEIGNGEGISDCYMSIGEAFKGMNQFDSAMVYYSKAIPFYEKNGNEERTAYAYGSKGELLVLMKRYGESKMFFRKGLEIADKIGYTEAKMEIYDGLAKADSALGDYNASFADYKLYVIWKDSLQNEGNTKKQTEIEMQYEFYKIISADSVKNAEQKKRDDLKHDQEIQKQKMYTLGGAIGFLLMIIVTIISIRAFRNKQKANEIISHQKELVEEKQKEILDSIHYAKRIQKSLLPSEKYIEKSMDRLKNNNVK